MWRWRETNVDEMRKGMGQREEEEIEREIS